MALGTSLPWLGSLARDLLDLVVPVLCLGCHAPHPTPPPVCDPDVPEALGALLVPALKHLSDCFDVEVPVPLHPRRLSERGYNQSTELARPLGIPIVHDAVERVRDDWHIRGRAVLVVDDVVTTPLTTPRVHARRIACPRQRGQPVRSAG